MGSSWQGGSLSVVRLQGIKFTHHTSYLCHTDGQQLSGTGVAVISTYPGWRQSRHQARDQRGVSPPPPPGLFGAPSADEDVRCAEDHRTPTRERTLSYGLSSRLAAPPSRFANLAIFLGLRLLQPATLTEVIAAILWQPSRVFRPCKAPGLRLAGCMLHAAPAAGCVMALALK